MSLGATILFLIVFLDAGSTALGLHLGFFNREVNPVMAVFYKAGGPLLLFAVKVGVSAVFIGAIEYFRRRKLVGERRVRNYYFFAITAYLVIYVTGVIAANHI